MTDKNNDLIRKHYQTQANEYGSSSLSTMAERVVREKEVELIKKFLEIIRKKTSRNDLKILDIGCGNGYTLEVLQKENPSCHFYGLEFTDELLAIARDRNIAGCVLESGDIRDTDYPDSFFDAVYTERCLINILDYEQQKQSLAEIARILKPSGYFLMIECFTDGLENNNKARREMGLHEIEPAYHNRYFDKEKLFSDIRAIFEVADLAGSDPDEELQMIESNFLSSHYFVARILHPLLTRGDWVRNSEFVKFFSFLPPIGNYAPIQAFVLKRVMNR
ncbi:MAG: class I SAM-dependent methyltransferase [Anaerolineaceae bacterium]|nr:class I SAM-dependent methyltransferase [Anaerolineaceae bacterium]